MKTGEALGHPAGAPAVAECRVLHDFFSRAAQRWPEGIAIDIPPGQHRTLREQVTYRELDAESNRLAESVKPRVCGECVAAILLPRATRALYAAELAILKAGAAFVSLDSSFPDQRVREILEDCDAVVLLTDAAGKARAARLGLGALPIIECGAGERNTPPPGGPTRATVSGAAPTPASLAYIVYTSGTTGRPKGVMIEHRSVANLVASDLEAFRLTTGDRVAQGSSPAYDSSIEETWLALAAGATIVPMDDDTTRLGPDLVDWLRREHITVFCPPPTLLRASGCNDPETALPDLRLLYVGGEALPRDLADRWSQGRQLVNGYGPTECAVTCLRERIESGGPITIGRPIPGVDAWILNDALEEAAPDEQGDLFISGVCLARGYWRSPDLTAEKFIAHPRLGRLYRTGDVAHRDADGLFFYHGRADSQVKIRGYRIELGEIESRLAACPGVRDAVCHVQPDGGTTTLVAFVVAQDPDNPPDPTELRSLLSGSLPSYMVPAAIGLLAELPRTVGDKINRTALPRLKASAIHAGKETTLPRTDLEARLQNAFAIILESSAAISIHDDFFTDLGGDSLNAARLVTLLRDDPDTAWIAVRDVYEARTIAALAERKPARSSASAASFTPRAEAKEGRARPLLVTLAQTVFLGAILAIGAAAAWLVMDDALGYLIGEVGLVSSILFAPVAAMATIAVYTLLSLAIAVAAKRLLIGRYRPMVAPVWSGFYLRHWLTEVTAGLVPWEMLSGTTLEQLALRALGARIGKGVHIHRGVDLKRGGWDLLTIGDHVTLGQDAAVRLVDYHDGNIVIGPVSFENGASLDVRAGVSAHTVLEEGARLAALSWLSPGSRIPAGELWDGVPARPTGQEPQRPAVTPARALSPAGHAAALTIGRAAVFLLESLPLQALTILAFAFASLNSGQIWSWLAAPSARWAPGLAVAAAVTLSIPMRLAWMALLVRAVGRTPEGTIDLQSFAYIRVWLKGGLVERAGNWLSGTLFWPVWLRWAGMRIGRGCEISTILDVVPELVEIGEESFLADGIYLGSARIQHGCATLARTILGRNTFLGNHVVIHSGQRLPDDLLIGISTMADDRHFRAGSSWFGHPPFELPRREIVAADRRLTHEPSAIRYWNRVFWELLRFTLPVVPMLATLWWFRSLSTAAATLTPLAFWTLAAPAATLAAAGFLCLVVLALKWLLLGRVKPGQHPLWSCWCSRWDFLYVAWGRLAQPLLARLEGSLLLGWYLRAMGMRIGKRVVLGPGFSQVVDPDMIEIGDGATVQAMFQAHTFEDRVLKIDRVTIGPGATVGAASVPLYGADIGAGTEVAPHSVIMKRERLLAGRRYAGSPAAAE